MLRTLVGPFPPSLPPSLYLPLYLSPPPHSLLLLLLLLLLLYFLNERLIVLFIQGVSRSAAVVLAYLIRNQGMSYDTAFTFLKRKRACVKPNPGFVQTLQEWEDAWKRPNIVRRFTS